MRPYSMTSYWQVNPLEQGRSETVSCSRRVHAQRVVASFPLVPTVDDGSLLVPTQSMRMGVAI